MRNKAGMKFECIFEEPLDFIDIDYTHLNKTIRYEQRPHGEWVIRQEHTKEGDDGGHGVYCSECDMHLITLSNIGLTLEEARHYLEDHIKRNKFCSNCGSDNRPKEGDEK